MSTHRTYILLLCSLIASAHAVQSSEGLTKRELKKINSGYQKLVTSDNILGITDFIQQLEAKKSINTKEKKAISSKIGELRKQRNNVFKNGSFDDTWSKEIAKAANAFDLSYMKSIASTLKQIKKAAPRQHKNIVQSHINDLSYSRLHFAEQTSQISQSACLVAYISGLQEIKQKRKAAKEAAASSLVIHNMTKLQDQTISEKERQALIAEAYKTLYTITSGWLFS